MEGQYGNVHTWRGRTIWMNHNLSTLKTEITPRMQGTPGT